MIGLNSAHELRCKYMWRGVYEFVAFLYFQLLRFSCIFKLGAPFNS